MPLLSQMRNSEAPMIQTPDGAIPEDEIPLPPLPAAVDKDPAALMDTRYECTLPGSTQLNTTPTCMELCLLKSRGLGLKLHPMNKLLFHIQDSIRHN